MASALPKAVAPRWTAFVVFTRSLPFRRAPAREVPMRLPMMARYRVSTLTALALSAMLLSGCAGESIAPVKVQTSEVRTSPFVPTAAQKALVGVSDGSYQFEVDPSKDERLQLGA